jgi:predicted TIM-barrel fold metal-dependent hydrolase
MNESMQRRTLLKSAAMLALTTMVKRTSGADSSLPVIDAHIHLFDPTRPGGVPWPQKTDTALYRPALPSRYAELAQPHGVLGAIAVECSPWMIDNFWLQDVVEKSEVMLGFIGDLLPEAPDFGATLDRLRRSPLFLGIRYGNLWNRDLGVAVQNADFALGLKLLSESGLVLETANPNAALIAAVVRVSDRIPGLRIVLDHLPHADVPAGGSERASYEANLRELSRRPTVFVKGSEIVRRIGGQVSRDVAEYKASLDQLWELFGEDRIFFGSDWPNSDSLASYDDTFGLAQKYIATRSPAAQEKYFWKNSVSVYRWRGRTRAQTRLQNA